MPTPMNDSWMERLVSVLRERWDGTSGDPAWAFTYAELGELAEQFPGTAHSFESGLLETTGEIHIRIKLLPEDTLSSSFAVDQTPTTYDAMERTERTA